MSKKSMSPLGGKCDIAKSTMEHLGEGVRELGFQQEPGTIFVIQFNSCSSFSKLVLINDYSDNSASIHMLWINVPSIFIEMT